MYKLQDTADEKATMDNGSIVTPVATLKDEHGGISHIVEDDHCYVLVNTCGGQSEPGKEATNVFCTVKHWYPEAVEALKTLPTPQYA